MYINRLDIKKKLEKKLTHETIEQAKGDFHAWRQKCVTLLPVISGNNCPFACTYCYIQSMESPSAQKSDPFAFKEPEPLNLSGEQLCWALLENKEFIPGEYGTPLAFGHVSEPFLPSLLENTLGYFKAISAYLGNPIQFSTKMFITPELAKKIKGSLKHKLVSPLVTITTLKNAAKLEPKAPPPEERFQSIANLSKAGYKVFLYLRPLIPGIVTEEIEEILKLAKKAGAIGVVGGGFRITLPILNRMKDAKADVSEIANRIPNIGDKQRYIYTKDLEDKVVTLAHNLKMVALRSTKCAMAYACKLPSPSLYWQYNKNICVKCKPCEKEAPKYKKSDIDKILKEVFPTETILSYKDEKGAVEIAVKLSEGKTSLEPWVPRVLETYLRKPVTIKRQ
ncbi:MAG: radical SAM protein [Planctomycetes bacterium]|nr:radical SAM protein [Planctomycetota bacterium]